MSKFQSTVSTVAALCSIFGVVAAGWKVAESKHTYESQQETIRELQSKLEDTSPEQSIQSTQPTQPTQLEPQVVQAPATPSLPVQPQVAPPPAPPAPPSQETGPQGPSSPGGVAQ